MNDLATYEIFWHFLYLTVLHGVELTADGKYSKAGDRVTPELFMKLLDERRETVKELFKKLGTVYENTNAELVLPVLKRQVVDAWRPIPRNAAAGCPCRRAGGNRIRRASPCGGSRRGTCRRAAGP